MQPTASSAKSRVWQLVPMTDAVNVAQLKGVDAKVDNLDSNAVNTTTARTTR
jgi:hypothetical protein